MMGKIESRGRAVRPHRMMWVGALAAGALTFARPAAAQEQELAQQCDVPGAPEEARAFCRAVVQGVEIAQPRLGLAFAGGNPVPGTASTLGIRLGTLPRVSLGGRITGVWVELPPILDQDDADEIEFVAPSLDVDASIGVFSGVSIAPTLGGVGSVDLLASVGLIPLPGDEGFVDDAPLSWAVGARLGLLRESFTAPGISVSAMYRRMEDVAFGDPDLVEDDAFFETDLTMWSLRGAVSKRLFVFGLAAGAGYDHFSSDVAIAARTGTTTVSVAAEDFENSNVSAFVNASWTLLILNVVGEVGWQAGVGAVEGISAGRLDFDPEEGTFFGSFAIRISI